MPEKNSKIGARQALACANDPKLHFTLNHYMNNEASEKDISESSGPEEK